MMEVTTAEAFWLDRGRRYCDEFQRHSFVARRYFQLQEKALVKVLNGFSFDSVLEVGCGFGRITKLIKDKFPISRLKGIDLSPSQIENARKYVKNEEVELSVGRIQDLDIPDNSYDLVIAVEVLMHVPFEEIEAAVAQLVRVSRNHIVNLDWYRQRSGIQIGGYCYAHDYVSLYRKFGVRKIDVIPIPTIPRYDVVLEGKRFQECGGLKILDSVLNILNPPKRILAGNFPFGMKISASYPEMQRIYHAKR